eukprot:1159566-Pelagomonas_calceolata.AAC.11
MPNAGSIPEHTQNPENRVRLNTFCCVTSKVFEELWPHATSMACIDEDDSILTGPSRCSKKSGDGRSSSSKVVGALLTHSPIPPRRGRSESAYKNLVRTSIVRAWSLLKMKQISRALSLPMQAQVSRMGAVHKMENKNLENYFN